MSSVEKTLKNQKEERRRLHKDTYKNLPGFQTLEAKGADVQEVTMPATSWKITRQGGQQDAKHRGP